MSKNRRATNLVTSIIAIGVLGVSSQDVNGDSITLKPSVRVATDAQIVRLGDIAELKGEEAVRWAELEVAQLNDATTAVEIDVRQVREALDKAEARWGVIELNGKQTTVRPRRSRDASMLSAMQPVSLDDGDARMLERVSVPTEAIWTDAEALIQQNTLRSAITEVVIHGLLMQPSDVRLQFDGKDAAILDTPISSYRFEMEPLSSFKSDRIELAVRFWSGQTIVQRHSLGLRAQVRVQAATLVRDVERGSMIDEAAAQNHDQWVSPTVATDVMDTVRSVGRFALRDMKAGEFVRGTLLRKDMVVKRGEQVRVRCIVGGVCISMMAEARADGADGDVIELRKIGERQTFQARISGAGEAIVEAGNG